MDWKKQRLWRSSITTRLGNIETAGPVYFRNQPVGCTATIIYQMYQEHGVEITPQYAGILCSAIISDTLMFRSPTCTAIDISTAEHLAQIADVNMEELSAAMFKAGSNLEGKTPKELFYRDFKQFPCRRYAVWGWSDQFYGRRRDQEDEGDAERLSAESIERQSRRYDILYAD